MSGHRSAKRLLDGGRFALADGRDQGLPTTPRLVSTMVLLVQRVGPFGEPLFSQDPILFGPALGQPLEVPSLRIWMADHDQRHALSRRESQGCLRLEKTFFIAGFNESHEANASMGGVSCPGREDSLLQPSAQRELESSGHDRLGPVRRLG